MDGVNGNNHAFKTDPYSHTHRQPHTHTPSLLQTHHDPPLSHWTMHKYELSNAAIPAKTLEPAQARSVWNFRLLRLHSVSVGHISALANLWATWTQLNTRIYINGPNIHIASPNKRLSGGFLIHLCTERFILLYFLDNNVTTRH